MNRIDNPVDLQPLYQRYQDTVFFFPLIAAVLTGQQAGVVFSSAGENPDLFYVEHDFGFAQLFSHSDISFEQMSLFFDFLDRRVRTCRHKIRLYWTQTQSFGLADKPYCSQSYRQRFMLSRDTFSAKQAGQVMDAPTETDLDSWSLSKLEETFGIVTRFWRSKDDFRKNSLATFITQNNAIASVCYAAANVSGFAEIDVATDPKFQRSGFGLVTARAFIDHCLKADIQPLWDCFTNNEPSMRLAKALGFVPYREPYSFYTLSA